MAESAASRILGRAAKERLAPLGLVRKGRSRLWLDDHGWWVIEVLLEGGGFAQGARLVVGIQPLWVKDPVGLYPSVGGRVSIDGFVLDHDLRELSISLEDDDEARFAQDASMLVDRAVRELGGWRERFPDFQAVAAHLEHLGRHPPKYERDPITAHFDAGIAAGLVGRTRASRRWLRKVRRAGNPDGWFDDMKATAKRLRDLADDPDAFRAAVAERVERSRAELGLPPLDGRPPV